MKKITVLLLAICIAHITKAQTFAEWFQQGKTQKKYLAEQIAALQAYAIVLKKGYDISQKGLTAIGDIKNGDFGLHSLYFSSLKAVNPEVAKYPRVADILTLQQNIAGLSEGSKSKAMQSGLFTTAQTGYISSVYDRLHKDCLQTLSDLEAVTTPGKLEMKDDERIKRIDALFATSQSQYGFAKSFGSNLQLMMLQKGSDKKDLQTVHNMYGIQ